MAAIRLGTLLALSMTISVAPSVASAAEPDQTVQRLYGMCKEPLGSPNNTICLGYIAGVGATMQLIGAGNRPELRHLAICEKPSNGAMVQAFLNWADKNPGELTSNQIVGVMLALRQSWPCR